MGSTDFTDVSPSVLAIPALVEPFDELFPLYDAVPAAKFPLALFRLGFSLFLMGEA